MKTLALLIAVFLVPFTARAQDITAHEGSLIESADVSGLPFDQLSSGLRQDISGLAGQRLQTETVEAIGGRIEAERPDVVSAVRGIARPDGRVRIIFLVARIGDDPDLAANINARYIVEAVEIAGIPESRVSQTLRDAIHALAGKRLDPDEAGRLEDRLQSELPGFDVTRRVARGNQPGHVRLIFEISEVVPPPWIPYTPSRSRLIYHADLGWSGALDIPIGGPRNNRVTFGFMFGNAEDLIKEFSGYSLRFENRKAGTDRLGVRFDLSRYRQDWQDVTVSAAGADSRIPDLYRTRVTVEPAVTFAFSPHVRVSGGVSISELEALDDPAASQMASAVIATIGFGQTWGDGSRSDPHNGKRAIRRVSMQPTSFERPRPRSASDVSYRSPGSAVRSPEHRVTIRGMETIGRVESLWRYPVKSMRGEQLPMVFAGFPGVYGDRLYAFRSSAAPKGFPYLTAREQAKMLQYVATYRHPERMVLPPNLDEAQALGSGVTPQYAEPDDLMVDVQTSPGNVLAIDDPAMTDLLREGRRDGLDVTLIRSQRALTDCRPLAMISIQTIRQLSQEVGVELDKRRFRANVYIDLAAGAAFCEDAWVGRTLRIGATTKIAVTARDSRCKMITDPDTSRANPDVMRRVSERHDGTAGVYAAVLVEGTVRAGDEIMLLD